jgi:zinc protease
VTAVAPSIVPELGPPPRARKPRVVTRTLATGLQVVVVRQPGVPLVELRLRIPFAARGRNPDAFAARAAVLSDALLAGTAEHSQVEIAELLQRIGGELSASADADRLQLNGSTLATGLPSLLGLVAEILTGAAYPARQVGVERDRLVERISLARAQPSVLAREALLRRLYGAHPYGQVIPDEGAVAQVTPAQLRTLHQQRVLPSGSVLVLVGDLSPARALDLAEKVLSDWSATGTAAQVPPLPAITPGPTLLVNRPGSVQSAIRLGLPALRRDDPEYPAYQLANMVFGGYFSSRLTENIREDKGYTYTPQSRIDHAPAGSTLLVQADVATEVSAPALHEIGYELGKIATTEVTEDELESVRQYAIGTLALSIATQSGLASTLSALEGVGLGIDWLIGHPQALAKVTRDQVNAAGRHFAPANAVTVVLGEAEQMADAVGRLGPIEIDQ